MVKLMFSASSQDYLSTATERRPQPRLYVALATATHSHSRTHSQISTRICYAEHLQNSSWLGFRSDGAAATRVMPKLIIVVWLTAAWEPVAAGSLLDSRTALERRGVSSGSNLRNCWLKRNHRDPFHDQSKCGSDRFFIQHLL